MIFTGRIHKFGDHVDTDVIIPATLLSNTDPKILGRGAFSEVFPGFADRVKPGDLIFAGENFGCGSSREHAPIAIKGAGISCVVAASFSRIFYRSGGVITVKTGDDWWSFGKEVNGPGNYYLRKIASPFRSIEFKLASVEAIQPRRGHFRVTPGKDASAHE